MLIRYMMDKKRCITKCPFNIKSYINTYKWDVMVGSTVCKKECPYFVFKIPFINRLVCNFKEGCNRNV